MTLSWGEREGTTCIQHPWPFSELLPGKGVSIYYDQYNSVQMQEGVQPLTLLQEGGREIKYADP